MYNFDENKNVLALFHFQKLLTVGVEVCNCAWLCMCLNGQILWFCTFTHHDKLSTTRFTDVVVAVVFTFYIVLNSCILNCFVF